MPTKPPRKSKRVSLLFGIGFDAHDGEARITKGRDFLLVGGSTETHELMTERAIKVNEELDRRGKRLSDVRSPAELRDIVLRVWK